MYVTKSGKLGGVELNADKLFFTSDLHFFHSNIIKYCKRPWVDAVGNPVPEAMGEGLIANWNSVVPKDGKVFVLGDIAMGGKSRAETLAGYLDRLNGEIFLIPGNHDTYVLESPCAEKINVMPGLLEINVPLGKRRQKIVLCHYALKVWNKSHHGTWHLFGHSHHTMPPDYSVKAIDVGIDGKGYDYRPLSFSQVENLMSMHGQESVDHHNSRTN